MNRTFFMQEAIKEAQKANIKDIVPNPFVGCIIVKNNQIISRGYHQKYGEAHAEINALNALKSDIKNADMYVTLEPCNHDGKTPACSKQIIDSRKIKRIYYASKDPNINATGGHGTLENAGIKISQGLCDKDAQKINKRFFTFHLKKRPYVILKYASTADGFIAKNNGESKWITKEDARKDVHILRSTCDAILVGRRTIEFDNPKLTSHGQGRDPKVIILSSKKAYSQYNVMKSNPLIFSCERNFKSPKENLKIILDNLFKENVQSLIVEGGGKTITSFIKSNFFDEIHAYISPKKFGQGIPFYDGDNFDDILKNFELVQQVNFKVDMKKVYVKKCLLD